MRKKSWLTATIGTGQAVSVIGSKIISTPSKMVLRTLDVVAVWGRWKTSLLAKNSMTIISVIMKTRLTSLLVIMVGNIPEQHMATIWMTWDFVRAFLVTGLACLGNNQQLPGQ